MRTLPVKYWAGPSADGVAPLRVIFMLASFKRDVGQFGAGGPAGRESLAAHGVDVDVDVDDASLSTRHGFD
jgi:hypothetical protein